MPVLPINHMEGHVLAGLAEREAEMLKIEDAKLPILALLISGGHTELVLMKEWLHYELLGQTRDDAVGEAFDKVARMLELPYPGGPQISKLAEITRSNLDQDRGSTSLRLPRPMINDGTCDFSFAGLKTAVLYLLKERNALTKTGMIYHTSLTEGTKGEIAHEFEDAVAEVLWKKTAKALMDSGAKILVIGGGVSANTHIRRTFKEEFPEVRLCIPTNDLTTDNAVMIALAGYYRALRGEFVTDIKANGNLSLANKP